MYAKLFPIFGYVIQSTFIKANEPVMDKWVRDGILQVDSVDDNNIQYMGPNRFVWFIASGRHVHTDTETGQERTLDAGWCSLVNPLPAGRHALTVPVDSHSVCLSSELNGGQMPDVEYFQLQAGEQMKVAVGTKMFLVDGEIEFDGKSAEGTRQLRFTSGDKTVTAKKHSFGLIFKK